MPGCNRKPASCTLVSGTNCLPPIGGLSMTLLSELFSYNTKTNISKCIRINAKANQLTIIPGPSTTQGRVGRKEDSCSLTFLLLNFEKVCSNP